VRNHPGWQHRRCESNDSARDRHRHRAHGDHLHHEHRRHHGVVAPAALAQSTAPFADAARVLAGDWAGAIVAIGAAISCFGALNGWVLIGGQVPLAVAQDGLFPQVFSRLSDRGTPARGMIIAGVLSSGLIAMNYSRGLVDLFTYIILLATLSTLVPYSFCSLAGFILRRREPGLRWSTGAAWIASLAFAYSFFAIAGAGADVVYSGFLLLICGLPVYVTMRGTRA
jgi:APA family basic amino acid/polyamine antiporter